MDKLDDEIDLPIHNLPAALEPDPASILCRQAAETLGVWGYWIQGEWNDGYGGHCILGALKTWESDPEVYRRAVRLVTEEIGKMETAYAVGAWLGSVVAWTIRRILFWRRLIPVTFREVKVTLWNDCICVSQGEAVALLRHAAQRRP